MAGNKSGYKTIGLTVPENLEFKRGEFKRELKTLFDDMWDSLSPENQTQIMEKHNEFAQKFMVVLQ